MYEALEFYLSLIQKEELGGLGLMPTQAEVDVLGDDVYFLSEGVALLVGKANLISVFNERSTFEYGIAPIPKHKDVIEASSSEAQGLSIWKNSKHKEEAYEFISYLASEEAQKEMAREGVYVPNQKTAAYEVYREENQIVENAILLAEVSEYQRPGDWTYMPDDAWLDEWTSYFNNQVRNSEMTLDEFFETVTDKVNLALERVISLD